MELLNLSVYILCACVSLSQAWNKHMEVPGLYQGDIQLNPEQWQRVMNGTNTYGSIVGRRWTGGKIPYVIESSIGSQGRQAIASAIADYHKYTCLRFSQRTNQNNYISFFNGRGCNSPVGMWGRNRISLEANGCQDKGTVLHEIGHSIGLQHEQCRPDRDSYVTIHLNNINGPWAYAFQKERNVNSLGTPYDLASMMHYSSTAFAYNGRKTITTKDSSKQKMIDTYNRITGFSEMDIKQINLMYKGECSATGGTGTGGTGTGGGNQCRDNNTSCAAWAAQGECRNNPRYMLNNCKKSCRQQC